MNLVNSTKLVAGYTVATDKAGRESLVVVAKGTYWVSNNPEGELALLEDQVPLVMADEFTGEPGESAPLYETDFAPCKPRCDVVVNGSCYAPGGRPATRVPVGVRVGSMSKVFDVVGHRVWEAGPVSCRAGPPLPFTVLPISYNNAYGGVDRTSENPAKHRWYPSNPAGVGYHPDHAAYEVDGARMPNTEALHDAIARPDGTHVPMAFGPLGRSWDLRLRWAGTYDKNWLDHQFPFLPLDFDIRYFQCAPEDQQIAYPGGGEEVVLFHLTPDGLVRFRLPRDLALPVLFASRTGSVTDIRAVVDTICIEPDEKRLSLVWRASLPLRRNIREISQVHVGTTIDQLRREREREKRMRLKRKFGSLAEVVEWSRAQRLASDVQDTATG